MSPTILGVTEVVFFFDEKTNTRDSRAIFARETGDGKIGFSICRVMREEGTEKSRTIEVTDQLFYSLRFDRNANLFVGELKREDGTSVFMMLDAEGKQVGKEVFGSLSHFKDGIAIGKIEVFETLVGTEGNIYFGFGDYLSFTLPDQDGFFTGVQLVRSGKETRIKMNMFRWMPKEKKIVAYSKEIES